MNWREEAKRLDYEDRDETELLLEIAHHFLCEYFGHKTDYANDIMIKFLKNYSSSYNEDFIHHEMSYRVAATIHFVIHLNGSPNKLGEWLIENVNKKHNPEADEYFRRHFDP